MARDPAPHSLSAPPQQVNVEILRVKAGHAFSVRTLTPARKGAHRILGCFTHFVKDRTWYCSGEDCPRAIHCTRLFWKAYLAVEVASQNHGFWYPAVLEVTEHTEQDLRDSYDRDQGWVISRESERNKKNAPVSAKFVKSLTSPTLPEAFDVRLVLYRVWHVFEVHLDTPNPMPARLTLPVTIRRKDE